MNKGVKVHVQLAPFKKENSHELPYMAFDLKIPYA
jgi:hypothetical protein